MGTVDKNAFASAGDTGLTSGPGGFRKLRRSKCAHHRDRVPRRPDASAPEAHAALLCNKRSRRGEKSVRRREVTPARRHSRKPLHSYKDPAQPKIGQ